MAQFRWPNRSSKSSLVRGMESEKLKRKEKGSIYCRGREIYNKWEARYNAK